MHSILLPTTHGDVAFSFRLTPTGRLTDIACPTLQLPQALLKISYPNSSPEELRRDVHAWYALLPWIIETAAWLEVVPEYLRDVVVKFRENTPDYSQRRAALLAIDPANAPDDLPEHLVRTSTLFRLGVAHHVALFPELFNSKKPIFSADKMGLSYRRTAADWLITAFPLADPYFTRDWITAMGKTRTTEANDYLFRQLERSGTLPYARQAFSVLANSRLKLDEGRILALYEDGDTIRDNVSAFVHLLNKIPSPRAAPLLQRIVEDYPHDALPALRRLSRYDGELARTTLQLVFTEARDYATAVAPLLLAVKLYGQDQSLFSLMAVNERLNDANFLDDEQVTWPQKLAMGWETILMHSSPAEVGQVAARYLPEARGRVARNILLQLRSYLQQRPDADLQLPPEIEPALIGMLNARHDKVSTVATDVLRLLFPRLHDQPTANQALLEHFMISRYRLMDAAALKVAANDPKLEITQRDFLADRIQHTATAADVGELQKLLPYFRFLRHYESLTESLRRRAGV